MANELISVIIPTFDREHLIVDALDSVYSQTYRPLEVIVVDDGSTDNTVDVVRNWIEEHSRTELFATRLIVQENMGGNAARNRGTEESIGTIIAFLDSDDTWLPDKLEKQVLLIDEPDVGGVYCGFLNVDMSTGQVTRVKRHYPTGWILDQLLIRDVTAPTSTYILRHEVFEEVGAFDLGLQARQDWDMWIRLASKYKIRAVPEALVQYRQHGDNQTASDPSREIHGFERIREKYAVLLKQQPLRVRNAATASFFKRMGRVHFHHGLSTAKAIRYYIAALFYQPTDFDTWAALVGVFLPTYLRHRLHHIWNDAFGGTSLEIRSH